jgi:tetratricopeptide (TPR) repeat protein
VAVYRQVLGAQPDHPEALHLLGVVMHQMGKSSDAAELIGKAVALDPNHAKAHANLGVALAAGGELDAAVAAYRKAIALDPDHAAAHFNLGVALGHLGKLDEAVAAYREAVAVEPGYAEAHSNLCAVLKDQGKLNEAVASCRRAVVCDPKLAGAYYNLGLALKGQDKLEPAIAAYRKAITLTPDFAEAHYNLAVALKGRGDLDEALAAHGEAITLKPGYPEPRFGRAVIHLLRGNFAAGWRDYLARASTRRASGKIHRNPLEPDLAGKRVVVIRDQGLGDEIFFLRFAPQLKARGVPIIYRGHPKIAAMVARISFIDRLAGPDDGPGSIDLMLYVGDLPYLLGMTDARDIPPSVEIPVLTDRLAEMRARLTSLGPPPYIGVTWRAGTQTPNHLSKIAPLESLAVALRPIGCTVVVVQRNPAAGEIESFAGALGRAVHDLTELNDDLEGMLALVDLLDDYVCVSNTNFHLRAVRGRVGRVLVPNPPEFRWMASGTESPWFPGTSVYRQTAGNDWEPALVGLERDLVIAWPAG